ncbi:MAG: hypothetical protein U0V72_12265 [Cytophagales bacterium]
MSTITAKNFIDKLLFVTIACAIVTCSYDIFLQVKISSFNIRFSVLCMIFAIFLFVFKAVLDRNTKIRMIAPFSLFMWVLILILFVGNTHFLSRNILYIVWLIIYIFFIIAFNQINLQSSFIQIFKIYVYSFGFLGLIGIIQFILFFVLGVNFYLEQVFESGIPRINAFCYEPSYFATFMLTGFVINQFLIINKSKYFNFNFLLINQFFVLVSILLSTSKMVIPIVLFLLFFSSITDLIYKIFRNFSVYTKDLLLMPVIIFGFVFIIYMFLYKFEDISFLFAGSGVGGTVSHSVEGRSLALEQTFQVFKKSPFVGCSLGGIPSSIGDLFGIVITNNETAKQFEGMNIFVETLAGSGIIGFIFFLIFLISVFYYPYIQSRFLFKNREFIEEAILIRSLFWSGVALLFMLNFNQNILRPYLWIHLGFLSLSFYYSKQIFNQNKL